MSVHISGVETGFNRKGDFGFQTLTDFTKIIETSFFEKIFF